MKSMHHFANSWKSVAWSALLLLLMSVQWVGGYWWVGSVYVVAKKRAMTAREAAIAADLRQQFGLHAAVRVEEQSRLRIIQGMGYGSTFYFTQERDHEKVFFTVVPSDTTSIHSLMPASGRDQEGPLLPSEIRPWFADYCFEDRVFDLQLPPRQGLLAPTKIPVGQTDLPVTHCATVPTPPPQRFA